MLDSIKQSVLIQLESLGWFRHSKESKIFKGRKILVTKGAFFREGEKDDAWLYLLGQHHRRIADVGCNVGQSSLLMTIGMENEIICIDPNPRALAICAENLIYNGLSERATFVNSFVSDKDGAEIEFYTVGSGAAGSMYASFARSAARLNQSTLVKTATLERICNSCSFNPDFIKIDVEGAEALVLQGMSGGVLMHKPDIFVEVHSGKELDIVSNTNRILRWCELNGYRAFYVKEHLPLTDVKRIERRGRYHLLLMPSEKEYPSYLKSVDENSTLDRVA